MHTSPSNLHRVLFVDDEPAILTGLGRMLRPLRHEIQSEFVGSGAEALERLTKEPFDIVIADIRMPGMDGAALLEAVQRAHPHVIRIVLSGHADVSAALRAVPVAHQFLAKPCDANMLRDVITRATGLHNLLEDRALQTLVAGMRDVPVRPKTYTELSKLLADPSATSRDISKLMSRDIALSAKLLKIVNSAFFGLPRRVTSIESAINYLGTSMLRSVILATAVVSALGPRATKLGYDLELNETHSLLCGNLATQFFSDKNAREDAFAAGLLQNVGELLLVAEGTDEALRAIKHAKAQNVSLHEAECELGVVSHASVGAYLLGAWGLPYSIVEAVAHHHDPARVPHEKLDIVDAVYVSTLIADHYLLQRTDGLDLARAYLEKFAAESRLPQIIRTAEHWLKMPQEQS
jgi:HD-like signal output (HDOD) protein/ActR/RegA family two-component response regulator